MKKKKFECVLCVYYFFIGRKGVVDNDKVGHMYTSFYIEKIRGSRERWTCDLYWYYDKVKTF